MQNNTICIGLFEFGEDEPLVICGDRFPNTPRGRAIAKLAIEEYYKLCEGDPEENLIAAILSTEECHAYL